MATYGDVIEGLQILAYHGEGLNDCLGGADHDIIYAGGVPLSPTKDSVAGRRLLKLGWHVDIEEDCWARFV